MKKTILTFILASMAMLVGTTEVAAQKDKSKRPSPPAQVTETVGNAKITIDYSQPAKNGRSIYGELVPFGQVWRTGANEATWIEISADMTVQGQTLKAGKYGLFTIPGADEWTIIFNKTWDQWGSGGYKEADDVLRVKAKSAKTAATERFTISLAKNGNVTIAWDETKVDFTIK